MTPLVKQPPTAADLEAARERLRPLVHHTPVLTSSTLDRRAGAQLFFKCESFQRMGAFKIRGASNALALLTPEELARGVTTHSSGNHAQALALAARLRGARATIVMPRTAPAVKLAAVRGQGAEVVLCEPTQAAREEATRQIIEEQGAILIHPYDDPRIIAGQATVAMELLEEIPDLDLLVAPVGGGGLISGTALAAHFFAPRVRVWGAEPAGADDAARALAAGQRVPIDPPRTVADGLLSAVSELTFEILRRHLAGVVTVEDEATIEAMRFLWERMKIVVEPSGSVAPAAALSGKIDLAGRRVGIILSGGNVDLDRLPWQASRS